MEKTNGYYIGKYLKNNAVVLLCELVIVLLLSLICTIIIGAQPMWLTPVIAVVTYLIAELRFMMAYVAINARHDREMLQSYGEGAKNVAEKTEIAMDETATVPTVADAVAAQDENDASDEADATEQSGATGEDFDEQIVEQSNGQPDEQEMNVEDMAEVLFESARNLSAPSSATMDEEDEAVDALFTSSEISLDTEPQEDEATFDTEWAEADNDDVQFAADASETEDEAQEIKLESIDMSVDDVLDDMTMEDDDFARDVLEIGEIENSQDRDPSQK